MASSTVPVPAASRVPAGFSHEEELFRSKWGWAAYDAVRRAARRESLQRAIIEKSLTGLVWAGLAFLGIVFYEYVISHGWRP